MVSKIFGRKDLKEHGMRYLEQLLDGNKMSIEYQDDLHLADLYCCQKRKI